MTGSARKTIVLKYHRVLPAVDPLQPGEIDEDGFRAHLTVLARLFNVLTIGEAVERIRDGKLPSRAVCLTFDDGYADNHDIALPLLEEYGLKATFFVATGYLDGGMMWNDRVIEAIRQCQDETLEADEFGRLSLSSNSERLNAIKTVLGAFKYLEATHRESAVQEFCELAGFYPEAKDSPMMKSEQVKAMADAGMEIGGHTVNHPILSRIDDQLAEQEIVNGKQELEALLGAQLVSFAYPNGAPGHDYHDAHIDMVKRAGFHGAVSVDWAVAQTNCDLFQIPRIWSWDRSSLKFGLRMLKTFYA